MHNNKLGSRSAISGSDSSILDAKIEQHQLCGSNNHCPGCGHKLEGRPDWVGLPAGVKFDPTDQELIEHLEAKVKKAVTDRDDNMKSQSHPLIDEFIPTIHGEDGICYTHPEKLPGVTRDGLSRHFFHRPSKAYTTGTRKRRKIQTECDLQPGGETRWHKTGKTRPVMSNGKQKGCKKILVLYTNFGKNRKPEKTNWVMHQYHLGQHEEEKEGELVVSKIFYQTQPRQCNWSSDKITAGELGNIGRRDSTTGTSKERDIDSAGGIGASISSYASLDIHHQHLKSHHFTFAPFTRSFDEVGLMEERSTERKTGSGGATGTCGGGGGEFEMRSEHQQHHHHHHHHSSVAAVHHHHELIGSGSSTGFHMSQVNHQIAATIISPLQLLNHSSMVLDHHHQDSYHDSSPIMNIQNQAFHQINEEEEEDGREREHNDNNKMGGEVVGRSSASGLEELIMGCTTSSTTIKQQPETSMTNPREADWMKYSAFWPDPNIHGHG